MPKRRLTTTSLLIWGALATLFFSGCIFDRKPPEESIAVVGEDYLTPEDVTHTLEEMGLDADDPMLRAQVVNRWVDRRIMMHEAKRLGFHKDDRIARRLEELQTEMVINKLIEEELRVDDPTDEEVVTYWQNHTGEFTRVTDEVKLIISYAPTRNQAWGIRNGLDRSATGKELRGLYPEVRIDTTGAVSIERLPKRLVRAIEPLRSGQASLPFELEKQWLVVRLVERINNGRPRPLDEMMPSIRARMIAEERARRQVAYIAALRREARRRGIVDVRVPGEIGMDLSEDVEQDTTGSNP
ncbi:peptidyl-prolyl cis-trans isomerase [bacterium]|nr:peptidyl-prolyl cis-trans isomerase [bacterium]